MAANTVTVYDVTDCYMEALRNHDWRALPCTRGLRVTENGPRLHLGRGLWETVQEVNTPYLTVIDESAETSVSLTLIREANFDCVLALRLSLREGRIGEVESIVCRNLKAKREGFVFDRAGCETTRTAFSERGSGEGRPSRDELIAAVNGYLDALSSGQPPASAPAARTENGVRAFEEEARTPDAMRAVSLGSALGSLQLRDRRLWAIDPGRSVLVMNLFVDHRGPVRGAQPDEASPFTYPGTLGLVAAFRLSGQEIVDLQIASEVLPYGMRSGWGAVNRSGSGDGNAALVRA